MAMTSQWCRSLSRMAVARTSSPRTPPHSCGLGSCSWWCVWPVTCGLVGFGVSLVFEA